jgi:hypothetical protein
MSKMGLHDPFGHLKHKLWPKEVLGVKLPIWLATIKSLESPQFCCVQVACNILLKSSWRGLQLFLRPHLDRRSTHKGMRPQSCGSPNFGNFRTGPWQNAIWMMVLWPITKYNLRGTVVASPKSRPWWVLCVRVCLWFVLAPKNAQTMH